MLKEPVSERFYLKTAKMKLWELFENNLLLHRYCDFGQFQHPSRSETSKVIMTNNNNNNQLSCLDSELISLWPSK